MPKIRLKTHLARWKWMIALLDVWVTTPAVPGEGGEGPEATAAGSRKR